MSETYTITVEPLGREVECREDQTILDACLRNGVWLPHSCTHGTCATCKAEVLDGDVDHGAASTFALMDYERDEGKLLPCVACPRSDVTIEADIDVDESVEVYPGAGLHRHRRRARRRSPSTPDAWSSTSTVRSASTPASTSSSRCLPGTGSRRRPHLVDRLAADRGRRLEFHDPQRPRWARHRRLGLRGARPRRHGVVSGPYGRFVLEDR